MDERGERELLEAVAASSREGLVGLALRVTRDPDLAEDACQDAYLALCRGFHKRTPIANPAAWLRRVVLRQAMARVRARAKDARRTVSLHRLHGLAAPAPSNGDAAADVSAVQAALAGLPHEVREAVWLCVVGGATLEEAAQALGCSVPTAWRRVRDGVAALTGAVARPLEPDGSLSAATC